MRVPAQRGPHDQPLWSHEQPESAAGEQVRPVVDRSELSALLDGPWVGCWYWRADLEATQAAAWEVHRRGGTRTLSAIADYLPTDQWVPHPSQDRWPGWRGRIWLYSPPADARACLLTTRRLDRLAQRATAAARSLASA